MVCLMQGAAFSQYNQALRTPAARYFGGQSQAAYSQSPGMSGATAYVASAQPMPGGNSKPFQHIQQAPTLSPYLNLDLVPESATSVPNFYGFVLPQLQNQAAAEAQAREYQRMRQQERAAAARGMVAKNPLAGVPTTGSSLQFMNVGSYFPTPK
jgi:hypothetical protein